MTGSDKTIHYDEFGPSWYDRHWFAIGPKMSPCHLWAANRVRKPLLDVGGGPGLLLDMLEDANGAVTVDFSPVAVEQCRKKGYETAVVSAESIPFPDASFRTVVAIELLEHIDDLDAAMAELHRVATEQIIITVPPNMASRSHKRVWPIEQWQETLKVGQPDFYDGVHVGWIVAPDPWRKAERGRLLMDYDPARRPLKHHFAAHVTCTQDRQGLHLRTDPAGPASAHLLMARGKAAAMEPRDGIAADPQACFVGRVSSRIPAGQGARVFMIWYDREGRRLGQDSLASLRDSSQATAFSFYSPENASHFALAISPDSSPAGGDISITSLIIRSVEVDEPYRGMLQRVREHG